MKVSFILGSCLVLNMLAATHKVLSEENKENNQKQADIVSLNNEKDVVSYTMHKNDKEFIANLSKKYKGLSNEQKINDLLNQQNYMEVLNYLWTEPDQSKRLQWLEKKANEGHPILLFELGEEYYNQDPSVSTYVTKTMPWLLTAARRTLIDTACSSDETVSAAPEFLLENYQQRILSKLRAKHSQEEIEKYISDHSDELKKNSRNVLRKVLEPFGADDQQNNLSPKWVFTHGMNAFTDTKNTISDSECNNLRKKVAQEFLKQINQAENSTEK